jgi:histidine triad (HIT) family protein
VISVDGLSHEPAGYECPFCSLLAGGETAWDSPRDIVLQTDRATAKVASVWWPNNPGHVIVVPNGHYENIYELPDEYGHAVHDAVRRVAIAMRAAYSCAGITVRQHNEPAGGQEIWHHHVHVIPRYPDDNLNGSALGPAIAPLDTRRPYAEKLRQRLAGEAI